MLTENWNRTLNKQLPHWQHNFKSNKVFTKRTSQFVEPIENSYKQTDSGSQANREVAGHKQTEKQTDTGNHDQLDRRTEKETARDKYLDR